MSRKNDLSVIDKERQVLELRRAGLTFDVIAQQVGYSNASGAYHAMRRAMQRTLNNAGSEEIRELEADRLDRLQRFAWPQAAQGDLRAIESVLRIMARRARLLGLDAPIRQEVTTYEGGSDIDREVQRLVAILETNSGSASNLAERISEDGTVTSEG
jgi:AraC-like DNA-binding protein